ncbi:MAG: glycosyltransferase family 4 protein, partial [Planctomycetota bacterium]
ADKPKREVVILGVDPARTHVVHNAVPRATARARLGVADAAPNVLFLGRLTRQKGPAFFLEAAARIGALRPDARFVVAGDGDLRPWLEREAQRLGIGGRVSFPGFLEGAEVERAYAAADVYVLPSLSEPFGLTALEALSYDTPVIVSRTSGVAEALPSSIQIDHGDVEDLARQVVRLLDRPDLARELVANCRREIEHLRWEGVAERLVAIYSSVREVSFA